MKCAHVPQWPSNKGWLKTKKSTTPSSWRHTTPPGTILLKPPAGIKRLAHLFLFRSVLQQQKCVFRCSWMSHVLRSKSRAAVKIPSLLLPLSNYSLPADKLQVCCGSSFSTGIQQVRPACFWLDGILLLGALAKYMLTFLVQRNTEGVKQERSIFSKSFPENILNKDKIFFCITENFLTCTTTWLHHYAQEKQNVPVYGIFWGKFDMANFWQMIYLEDYRWTDKLRTRLTLDWKRGC